MDHGHCRCSYRAGLLFNSDCAFEFYSQAGVTAHAMGGLALQCVYFCLWHHALDGHLDHLAA